MGKEDPANMGQGETTGCDYDVFDKMSNAADRLKAQFADKASHTICFIQVLLHNFARYFFPECTVVS